jgi:hypothetical protein
MKSLDLTQLNQSNRKTALEKASARDRQESNREVRHDLVQYKAQRATTIDKDKRLLKRVLLTIGCLFIAGCAALALLYGYIHITTTPIIEEVPVEVVPEECSQVRRNGKIYMNCDGVKVDGVTTLGPNVDNVPELLE